MVSLRILITLQLFVVIFAAPEQGKFSKTVTDSEEVGFVKTLYKDSEVRLKATSSKCEPSNATLTIKWLLRSSSCYREYTALIMSGKNEISLLMNDPDLSLPYSRGYYIRNQGEDLDCTCKTMTFIDYSSHMWTAYPKKIPTTAAETTITTCTVKPISLHREKRADTSADPTKLPSSTDGTKTKTPLKPYDVGQTTKPKKPDDKNVIASTPHEASYILIVKVESAGSFEVAISAEMESPKGYLSAHEYPLLSFYMIMGSIYSFFALAWLIMSFCNLKDLPQVQLWIGGVILLGMVEMAVLYSEYLVVNSTGEAVSGACSMFAVGVSAMKRALHRMLVISVTLGLGIVKPRLGMVLRTIVGVGILYFIVAVIVEGLVHTNTLIKDPSSNNALFASIPLAVIDLIIFWWFVKSLVHTMRELRSQEDFEKLSLYRYFSYSIVLCVIASLLIIFYSLRFHDMCITEWQEIWIEDALWHILSLVFLFVIMVICAGAPKMKNRHNGLTPIFL